MTDVATARPTSDAPPPKDAPKTFAERGVAVPFTTAELLWARVRQKGNTRELLISGLAQTRGTYVYEWNTIRNRFALTLHDRLLHKAILTGPTPTPETVRFAALRVAGNGSGGGDAQMLAETANREAENFGIHLRAAVIRRLTEHAQRPDLALTVEELSTPDGLRQAAGTVGMLAPGFRLTEGALQERVDALCSTLAQVGLSGLATEPPPRRVVQRLGLLASALTGWADQGYGDGEGEARLIARTAAETARIAGAALDAIDRDLSNIDGFLAGWSAGRFDTVRGNALRAVWLLDGWERIFRIWQNVSTQDDKARAKALTLMSYVVPLVPTAELERDAAKSWDEINAELTKIIAAHQEGIDLATMLKLLGPDGDKALAGLAMPPPQAKRGAAGLSPEKLTQIVRILEPAMDRPDGAPARKMLDELRVHLVRVRPPRAVRAQRALCATFQELLVDGEETSKASARIPRSAITPAWTLFRERVNDEEYLSVAPVVGRPENLAKLRQMFVAALKPDLDDAAAFASKARALIVRLGSESHYHALQSMVAAVGVAEPLDRLRKALPKRPIAQFEEPDLDRLADALNDIRRAAPQQVQTALFVVMDAMEEPWRISSVLEQLATTGRFRSSAGISGFVATAMIGQIEGQVQDVRKLADALPEGNAAPAKLGESAMALAQSIAHAADSISGTNATLAVAGSHGQIQEVETLRAKLTELVGSKLGSGAAALVSALTGKPATTTSTGAVRPGARWRFDEPPDGEALRNAELYAMALKRSEGCAGALGMGSQITDSLAQTLEEFEKTVTVLFSQMRSAGLDRVTREYARAHVSGIARVIEVLAGADRGERILDKGLEAIG